MSATPPGSVAIICGPAGGGKTMLLRSWVEAEGLEEQVAWVSVERGEQDAQRFWLSVIDELGSTAAARDLIYRASPAPEFHGDALVEGLLGDLWSLEDHVVLVIDDLHELRSPTALALLELFLSELPPHLTVMLSTREDPRLRLHRLRLTGALTEIRADDLRFSREESEALLRNAGIELSDAEVSLLHERTEGWAAGLRLASISLSGRSDPGRFVAGFSGSERTVAGYLMAEVLEHQPAEVRELLLRTSLLERVSGPLADFLTGASGSERILQELEDANAFVTSIDSCRSWFRYHHLFADLLQLELRRVAPASIAPLHRAAAEWLEAQGHVVQATRHAQAARDWPLAARLLADNHLDLTLDGRSRIVSDLLDTLPSGAESEDPELALVFATACLMRGELDDSAAYTGLAARTAEAVPQDRRDDFNLFLALMQLVLAHWRGDLETALENKRVVQAGVAAQPAGRQRIRDEFSSIALENLGASELWALQVHEASRDLEQARALAIRAERPWLEISALGHLAIAAPLTGQTFAAALRLSEEAVKIAEAHGWPEDPITVTALAAGAVYLLWLGRFDEADAWVARAQRTLQPGGEPAGEVIVHDACGLLRMAQGRFDDALAAFREVERVQELLVSEHPFTVAARARVIYVLARMGDLPAARARYAEIGEEHRQHAYFRVAAGVVGLESGAFVEAIDVLEPVIENTVPTVHGPTSMTEAQVLDALARDQLGDARGAEASIERALDLAEPEGLLLPFALAPTRQLLERRRHRTAHPTFLAAILDMLAGGPRSPESGVGVLRENLSEAELRVLRYLPGNMKAPEIASELFVSNNTVRTHLRHIYAKLDAHTRSEAVERARSLRLIGPASGVV